MREQDTPWIFALILSGLFWLATSGVSWDPISQAQQGSSYTRR
jgi:hypothetical protein